MLSSVRKGCFGLAQVLNVGTRIQGFEHVGTNSVFLIHSSHVLQPPRPLIDRVLRSNRKKNTLLLVKLNTQDNSQER